MSSNALPKDQGVLFVDDEPAVLQALRRSLHNASFSRYFAESAYEALEIIDSNKINIVVADEQMPSMSGSELFAIIHNRCPEIIRIILSGQANLERVIAAINTGHVHRFLTKPVDSAQLVAILEEYLCSLRVNSIKMELSSKTDTVGRWEWDILRSKWYWNESFAKIMNIFESQNNADFSSLFSTVHHEDRAELLSIIYSCRDTGNNKEIEYRIVDFNGSVRWIAQFMDVYKDGDKSWKIFGMLRDITEFKEKEKNQSARLIMLQTTLHKTIDALARMAETRDPYTAGHQMRVARIAKEIGKRLGLDPRRLEGLEIAAKLHDIGKVYLPMEFLAKPVRLREAEESLMKLHPEIGSHIVRDIPFGIPVADIIMQHHERLDGTGYPKGLTGDDIIFEAKIIAVADVFEKISSYSPFRPGMGVDAALNELMAERGGAFDASVVDAIEYLVADFPQFLDF